MSEEINRLKAEEKQESSSPNGEVVSTPSQRHNQHHKKGESITGPLILILIGAYFLLRNLGYTNLELNWWIVGRFWPLFLIFIGLNIVAGQVKGGAGSLLRGLISIAFVTVFGSLLLWGDQLPLVSTYEAAEVQVQNISIPQRDVSTAEVTIDFSNARASLTALEDSNNLLAGTVSYLDSVETSVDYDGDTAELSLDTDDSLFFWGGWNVSLTPWELSLNSSIPTDLRLDLANGRTELDLDDLTLTYLRIDAGNGGTSVTMPGGDYDIRYEAGNGSAKLVLPPTGRHHMNLDAANGAMTIELPPTMEARIEIDDGNGRFNLPAHLQLVSGEAYGDSVWETPNYRSNAANVIEIDLEMGNGAVTFESSGLSTGR